MNHSLRLPRILFLLSNELCRVVRVEKKFALRFHACCKEQILHSRVAC